MAHKTVIDCDRCGQVLPSEGIQSSAQVVMYHRSGPSGVTVGYFCYTQREGGGSCGDDLLEAVRNLATAEDVVPPAPVPAPLVDPVVPSPAPPKDTSVSKKDGESRS